MNYLKKYVAVISVALLIGTVAPLAAQNPSYGFSTHMIAQFKNICVEFDKISTVILQSAVSVFQEAQEDLEYKTDSFPGSLGFKERLQLFPDNRALRLQQRFHPYGDHEFLPKLAAEWNDFVAVAIAYDNAKDLQSLKALEKACDRVIDAAHEIGRIIHGKEYGLE